MTIDWKALFFSAQGRISRQPFWIGWILTFIAGGLLGFAFGRIHQVVALIVALAFCYPWACIYSKRLHDVGQSGWLAAIPIGLQMAASAYSTVFLLSHPDLAALAKNPFAIMGDVEAAQRLAQEMRPISMTGNIVLLVNLVFLLWLGIANSQQGPNKYGLNPQDVDESEAF